METRIIHTNFWQSEDVQKLSKDARLLFIYFLSCPYIKLTGIFEINDGYITMETGLNSEELKIAKKELQKTGKAYFYKGWVMVVNAVRHNRYNVGKFTSVGFHKEAKNIPSFVIEGFKAIKDTTLRLPSDYLDTPINNKEEIRNNNKEIINKKSVLVKKLDINSL